MKVVAIEDCGGSKVLKYRDEQLPVLKDDEVLILVSATGVNKLDVLRIHHEYELAPDWNPVPGLECAGTIMDVGKNVNEWKFGDEVCALLNGGGYANAVVVRATQVLPLPLHTKFMNLVGCLPEVACTTWEAISRLSKLSANMTLLVYERCGRICDLAVQLAETVQARVIIAIEESTSVKKFSSHVTVEVNSSHFLTKVLQETANEGVDVILDSDVSTVDNPIALRLGGTIVIVEVGPEKMANVDLTNLCSANGVLHVVNRMWWTPKYMAAVVLDMREKMWPAFTSGRLKIPGEGAGRIHLLSEVANADAHIGDVITPLGYMKLDVAKRRQKPSRLDLIPMK